MRKLVAILGIAVVSFSASSIPAASVATAATTATQSSLYLVSTNELGATLREWFLSDGSRERQATVSSTGTIQFEQGQAFSIDSSGIYRIATLTLNFVAIGGGTNGESTPGRTWSLQTTEDSCQAVCADGGSGLFFGPKAIKFSMSSHYASAMRSAPCAVQGGCPQFRVTDKAARLREQSVFELQETEPGHCTLSSQPNCTTFTDYWITKGSDMMLESVHGIVGSTKTTIQTYHWAKLTTTNCDNLAVTVPSGFARLPTSSQSELVRNVWPKLDCSNVGAL